MNLKWRPNKNPNLVKRRNEVDHVLIHAKDGNINIHFYTYIKFSIIYAEERKKAFEDIDKEKEYQMKLEKLLESVEN